MRRRIALGSPARELCARTVASMSQPDDIEEGDVLGREHWYLLAWCRLRDGARVFRLDRIRSATWTDEVVPGRPFAVGGPS